MAEATPEPMGQWPCRLESPSGVRVEVNANGSIRRIDRGDVTVTLFPGNEAEGGPANLYLRRHGPTLEHVALLGPSAGGRVGVDDGRLVVAGAWGDLRFALTLVLARSAAAWFWHVAIENAGVAPVTVDLLHAQDVALTTYGAVRMNEYYVSQYLDHTPLAHPERGWLVGVRQNLAVGGRIPWALVGSLGRAASFATDALDVHGRAVRAGGAPAALARPALAGRRRQHEHALVALQEEPFELAPGARASRGFFVWLEDDHPAATGTADVEIAGRALALPEAAPPAALAAPSAAAALPTPPTSAAPAGASAPAAPPAPTLFTARPPLDCLDLDDADVARLFGTDLRHVERDGGTLLSFFAGQNRHVVLRAKELRALRPHGLLLRSGDHPTPDEASLTSTAWMAGVFHSQVTQGHASINRFLSATRSYLGLFRSAGQRLFVEIGGAWVLLGVPSAFEMTPGSGRWLYKHAEGLLAVRSWAATDRHELGLSVEVLSGPPVRLLVSHHVALGGDDGAEPVPPRVREADGAVLVLAVPDTDVGRRFPDGFFRIVPAAGTAVERVGGDEVLFLDGRSRAQPFLTLVTAPARRAGFRLTGGLVPSAATAPAAAASTAAAGTTTATAPSTTREPEDDEAEDVFWAGLTGQLALGSARPGPLAAAAARLGDLVPWLAHDAMVHYLAPRGLEQYSGGGWGTRDVCQGPVELLLALGRWAPLRDLLLRVFKNQNPDGDWPQWFMFFERERNIRPDDSHGDIVFWPVLALAQYLQATGDATLLDEVVPFFHRDGDARAERASLAEHVERALGVMRSRVIPGTALAKYGNGDWNDALQPADPAMRERLCSSWTVTLHVQTLEALAAARRVLGHAADAAALESAAAAVRADARRLLLPDGLLAGFAWFDPDGDVDYLMHPRDSTTGIRHSLLPMIHAVIADLLEPEQTRAQIERIRAHLLAADGARLFDRPAEYRGGPQRIFQRAETSTFFGREIGLMYVHAHLRYAEAMARWGDADAFLLALQQANPIGLRDVVPSAALRQANCYSSSSDAAVADRYEAAGRYGDVCAGRVPFEGGWRVYSSGAGIMFRLIHECLLGLKRGRVRLGIDPVLAPGLDGLEADVALEEHRVRVTYEVAARGVGPTALTLNDAPLAFERAANPWRTGGAVVSMAEVRKRLRPGRNTLVVALG